VELVPDRTPVGAVVEGIDLIVIRRGEEHSVLYGRCLHRRALLADGRVAGDTLLCGLDSWDHRIDTGVSTYNNAAALQKFASCLDGDDLTTIDGDMAHLSGISYDGRNAIRKGHEPPWRTTTTTPAGGTRSPPSTSCPRDG
jgi:nitrite reductase/ring-hydroxylating ferredoxin subunit